MIPSDVPVVSVELNLVSFIVLMVNEPLVVDSGSDDYQLLGAAEAAVVVDGPQAVAVSHE